MWTYNYELYHHGILGMRWGIRRFQKKDGSLTNSGKKRYDSRITEAKSKVKSAKKDYNKAYAVYKKETHNGWITSKKQMAILRTAKEEVDFQKRELSDTKAKIGLENQNKKSKRQLKFEEAYQNKGLTKQEAELAAYKRIRTEKAIAVTVGIAITAAAAYVAYKHYDNSVDKLIKPNTLLQNISTNSNRGVKDAFYASTNKIDDAKYRGIYGKQLNRGLFGELNNPIYETKIEVAKSLKVASPKNATNVLKDLVTKDKNYAKILKAELTSAVKPSEQQNKVVKDALSNLNNGKVNSKVYEALNLVLTDHSELGEATSKGLYKALKDNGYDAIKDINDSKYSGYKSKNPLIIFNGDAKTKINSVRQVTKDEIDKSEKIGYTDILTKQLAKSGAKYAAAFLGTKAVVEISNKKNDSQIVQEYRKDHPDSKLSYNEIIKNYKSK